MEDPNNKLFGKFAYEAYKKAVGGKTWNGEDMKEFSDMPEKIQNAWHEAGYAVEQTIVKLDEMTMTIRKLTHEAVIRLSEELALLDKAVEARKEEVIEQNLKLVRLEKRIAEKQEELKRKAEHKLSYTFKELKQEPKFINESDIDEDDEKIHNHDGH